MLTSDSLLVSIIPFLLLSVSVAPDCPSHLRTREAFVSSDSHPIDLTTWYSAVNVTLRTNETIVKRLFRLIPSATWINFSCEVNTSALTLISRISSTDSKSTEDVITTIREHMPNLPAWSLWADRSVLVMNIHKMELPIVDPCSRFSICPIFGLPSDKLLGSSNEALSLCDPELSEFSGDCLNVVAPGSMYSVLFPLSSAFTIRLSHLDPDPQSSFRPKFNLVLSAGYRLPPGVFQCPAGLFACPLPSYDILLPEFPKSSVQWNQRICLPLALRCDGVPNCPSSDFDELDCAGNLSTVARKFPEIPDELYLMRSYLRLQDENVLRAVGFERLSEARIGAMVWYSLLFALPLMGVLILVSGWLLYKRSCRKPYTSVIESNGHAPTIKEDIPGELLEEASVRLQNGKGALLDKSFDNDYCESAMELEVGQTSPSFDPRVNRIYVERV